MTNHEELMDTLKEVNQVIQRAGRLRIGKSKVKLFYKHTQYEVE